MLCVTWNKSWICDRAILLAILRMGNAITQRASMTQSSLSGDPSQQSALSVLHLTQSYWIVCNESVSWDVLSSAPRMNLVTAVYKSHMALQQQAITRCCSHPSCGIEAIYQCLTPYRICGLCNKSQGFIHSWDNRLCHFNWKRGRRNNAKHWIENRHETIDWSLIQTEFYFF